MFLTITDEDVLQRISWVVDACDWEKPAETGDRTYVIVGKLRKESYAQEDEISLTKSTPEFHTRAPSKVTMLLSPARPYSAGLWRCPSIGG